MINISKSGNAIKFVFTDSDHYLYGNGEIEVPVNSLSLIVDESNMVTFRKANSNDIFLSFNPANSNLSDKAGVIDFYKSNMVGSTGGGSGSGMTPSEVQEMIDESVSGKADTAVVNQAISEATAAILSVSGDVQTNAANIRDINDTIDEKEEVIASALTDVRQDVADIDAKEEVIASALTEVRQDVNTLSGDVQTKVATSDFNAYSAATDARLAEDEEVTAAALNNLDAAISGKADTSAVTAVNDALTAHTSDSGIHVTQADKTSWNAKAEPYSAGTGIEISGNVISATGGGGATYSAGTNISIDTANTINCTLNLRNGTQANSLTGVQGEVNSQNSFAFGANSTAGTSRLNEYAFAFGYNCKARKNRSFAFGGTVDVKEIDSAAFGQDITLNAPRSFSAGYHNVTNNWVNIALGEELTTNNRPEFATGTYNNSVTGSTASGQTLFSVGNGTADNARHNAFEIRQNGDIYVNDGTNDVRLQDTILALGGLKLVKLTQSEYDQLATKDPDTLYIITNVVS